MPCDIQKGFIMNSQKIKPCNKICKECGFIKGGATDTLYYETHAMMNKGILFPCHMELKAVSGNESYGVEQMDEVRVCRGYVAFMKKEREFYRKFIPFWGELMDEIDDSELENIYTTQELIKNHQPLRDGVCLGNNEGLV